MRVRYGHFCLLKGGKTALAAGTKLGQYEVRELIGQGGMARCIALTMPS